MPLGTQVGAALSVRDARVTYTARGNALLALDGVSFDIRPGEFVSLIGPSGCGKSTLLRAIAGLHRLDGGEIDLDGKRPSASVPGDIGVVFQQPALLPWRTVAGNVALPLASNKKGGDVAGVIDLVGLTPYSDFQPRQLSGGMQQRVALARALVAQPRLLLMDEPFAALDEITREDMREQLLQIWERDQRSVFFVTHSVAEAVLLSDRVLVMSPRPGRIIADIRVGLPRPRGADVVDMPEFQQHVKALRHHLRQ